MYRIIGFDLIRILAIFLIVTFHYNLLIEPIPYGAYFGFCGSTLFLLLSGFLLSLTFKEKDGYKIYFKKRFLAIFPATWIAFIVFYVLKAYLVKDLFYGGEFYKIIYSFLGIDGFLSIFNIKTYLVVGEWFTGTILILYLLFPVFNRCLKKYAILTTGILSILYLSSFWISIVHPEYLRPFSFDQFPVTSIYIFWLGMLMEKIYRQYGFSYYVLIPSLIGLLLSYLIPGLLSIGPGILIFCICIFLTIVTATQDLELPQKMVKILNYLSAITFMVYLTSHQIIYWTSDIALFNLDGTLEDHYWLIFFLILIITLIESTVLYEISQFLIRKANRFFNQ